jgi:hypothetical protein
MFMRASDRLRQAWNAATQYAGQFACGTSKARSPRQDRNGVPHTADGSPYRYRQIQKYENAANRVAAWQLSAIADALNTPIAHFLGRMKVESAFDPLSARRGDRLR